MVEKPCTSVDWMSRSRDEQTQSSSKSITKNKHYPTEENEEEDDQVVCSDCKSCTASLLADCVAICCCPCAVISLLTLTLVKVPWMMGRRCLVLAKKKCLIKKERRKLKEKKKEGNVSGAAIAGGNKIEFDLHQFQYQGCSSNRVGGDLNLGLPVEFVDDGETFCARVEAEKVWLELYQVGHLGFGRVSFTGIPPNNKTC